jgi:hypothetical protein
MEKPAPTIKAREPARRPQKKARRIIDAAALVLFHLAVLGLAAWLRRQDLLWLALMGICIIGADMLYYYFPREQKVRRSHETESANATPSAPARSYAPELLLVWGPPLLFIAWLLALAWQNQTLTWQKQLVIVMAMPAVVGLVSWIMKVRMTQYPGANATTKFIAGSILGIWIGATFFWIMFLGGLFLKLSLS